MPDSVCTQELLIRLHNANKSIAQTEPLIAVFARGKFRFDLQTKIATYNQVPIPLNKKETQLLVTFLQNPNRIFSAASLYNLIWQRTSYPTSNSLEVYMSSLRHKIEKPFGLALFTTFKGRGYGVLIN
jgi:DNA-binding response OmpR family regulator